jgi:hypothetical protein
MLSVFVAALLAAPADAEVDRLDQSMDDYQACLVANARKLHARDPKLVPERAVAAASPACEPQAAKMVAISKAQYSQRDSNGNVVSRLPVDAMLDDLRSAAVMRYRASEHFWKMRSQLWVAGKKKKNDSDATHGTNNGDDGRN